jgi:hypothetical protein
MRRLGGKVGKAHARKQLDACKLMKGAYIYHAGNTENIRIWTTRVRETKKQAASAGL